MISKEAIQRIKDDIEIGYLSTKHDNVKDKDNYLVMLKSIEKDLEILDILKKYVYFSSKSNCVRMKDIYKRTTNFDYETLKEWLENDSN